MPIPPGVRRMMPRIIAGAFWIKAYCIGAFCIWLSCILVRELFSADAAAGARRGAVAMPIRKAGRGE